MNRQVLASVLVLWAVVVLGAAITMSPLMTASPLSWDDQVFQPGALLLLESLRLHRAAFLEGGRQSLIAMAAVHVVILLARAQMTAAIVDRASERVPRTAFFSRAPAYLGVTFLKLILLGISGWFVFLVFGALPPLSGTLPPQLVLLYALTAIFSLLALGFLVVFADLYRLALFHECSARAQLTTAWSTARRHALPLLSARALWTLLGLGTGYLTLLCAARPIAEGTLGAILTFGLSQPLVLANLSAEVWWLTQAEQKLVLCSAPLLLHSEAE